jgi:3-dehydroquinate synthase
MAIPFDLITTRNTTTKLYVTEHNPELYKTVFAEYASDSCMLVVDENVQKSNSWIIDLVEKCFKKVVLAVVPSGEGSKSISEWSRIMDIALQSRVRRKTPLIAVGGGVTGDLAGFVAASVLRGLPLIHIPTTLLAMVDSSIGGKTGINHATGKNLIGAFYQPRHIIADMRFLETLPEREWNCGMGEILKYACISKTSIFDDANAVLNGEQGETLKKLISDCAQIKCDIVADDELESGARAFLNYGHTFAHALEAHTNYKRFAHGEAVYVGLLAATYYSQISGANVDSDRILSCRESFKLQTNDLIKDIPQLTEAMFSDKKIQDAALRLVVLKAWEQPKVEDVTDLQRVREAWHFALQKADIKNN